MGKVLTERPRAGGRDTYGSLSKRTRRKKITEEDTGFKQGMRRPYKETWDWKEFTDLTGPLYRFIASRVGKPWNKVHSEICKGLKGRSTQQQHLLDHVKRMVYTDIIAVDGVLKHANGTPLVLWGSHEYYVDPRDGILKTITDKERARRSDKAKIKAAEAEAKRTELTFDGQVFRKVDGIWYEITVVTEDVQIEERYFSQSHEERRQLGSQELKKRGLANDECKD